MLRRLLIILGAVALLLVAAVLASIVAVQTGPGQVWLTATLSRAMSSGGNQISINGLRGTVPSAMRVARIALADRDGAWLEIANATLDLQLADLLRGQLTVRRLAAESVTVTRTPVSEASPLVQGESARSFSLPQLPVRLAVEAVAIDRLQLGKALLGEAATLNLSARGGLTPEQASVRLAIERIDGTAGSLRLDFRFSRARDLALHLDAAEPTGTVLQRLLARAEPLPLNLAVHGEGPLDGWRGTVIATAGSDARVDADVRLRQSDTFSVASTGSLAIRSLLPPPFDALLLDPIRFATDAEIADGQLTLKDLMVATNVAKVAARAQLDRASQRLSVAAEIEAPDLQPIGAAFDLPLRGAVSARLNADGSTDEPRIAATLQGDTLDSGMRAERVTLNLAAARQSAVWSLRGSGDATGLGWVVERQGLPNALALTLDGRFDETASRAVLNDLTLRGAGVTIAASGRADDLNTTPRVQATVKLGADDLAQWRAAAGLQLAGHVALTSDIALADNVLTATIAGEGGDLATGDPRLDALLGGRIDLNAALRRGTDGALALDDLRIKGANIAVTGSGTSTAEFATLDARLAVDAPRLAVLAGALGTPVQGAAKIQAQVRGPSSQPTAQIEAAATDLRYGEQRVDRLAATLALSDALSPRGTLAATLKSGTLDANADLAFARTDDGVIDITRLALRGPATELNGALKVRTDRPAATGTMTLRAADLSPWSSLAGMPLAGAADVRIALAETGGQRADIDATISKLRLDAQQVAAERIKVEARLTDLLAKPAGRANVDAAAVTLPDLRLDSVRANAQSTKPYLFAVSIDARGALRPAADAQPLRLATAGEISRAGAEQRIRVTRVNGRIGEYDIVSRAPLTVAVGANSVKLDGLDLGIGPGRVTGTASRDGTRLAFQAQLRGLPLALMQLAVPDQKISGSVDASVRFTGTAAGPDGQLELTLRDVRVAAAGNLPPLAATTLSTWKGEALDVTGQVAAPDGTKVDIRGTLPLRLDTATLVPALIPDGRLRATLKGDGHLERWAALLPLGEDRISGRYMIDLAVGGTPSKPDPRGRFTISNGRYVNFAAGTEISDVTAEITADGTHFVLNRLAGRDGAKGTLDGNGSLDLGAGDTTFDITARFANFGLMRRDDLTASGDGTLHLVGTPSAAKVEGRVRVDRAEIRIPERLPPSIPRLPVVEVDSRSGEVISTPEQASAGAAITLALDVDIPARAFVRGRSLDSEWRGAIQVAGTTAVPRLTGKLQTVRGDFSLLGKRFSLTDSTINFVGGEKIDPELGITAQYQTAAILAQALINGPVSSPSIKLTSQPEMPQDEVLARVLFGRSVTEMTPAQGLELAQAAASLAGGGGPGILDRVRSATGLDRLDISSKETTANGGPSGTTATAGKYVSDRVFVGIEQGIKADSTRPRVEVEITPNLTVESSVGASSAGVGLNWKWDY
jgi:translocation and assembly module TamB